MASIFKRAPKILEIRVEVKPGHIGPMTLELVNPNYDQEKQIVDFCHIGIVRTGDNLPCVHMINDIAVENGTDTFEDADGWVGRLVVLLTRPHLAMASYKFLNYVLPVKSFPNR